MTPKSNDILYVAPQLSQAELGKVRYGEFGECRPENAEVFSVERGQLPFEAYRACAGCVVRSLCLEANARPSVPAPSGVTAGLSEAQMRKQVRPLAKTDMAAALLRGMELQEKNFERARMYFTKHSSEQAALPNPQAA